MLLCMVQLARFVRSIFGAEAAFALLAIASLNWRFDAETAGGWAIAASIFNLPLIPLGTAVGIAGLCAFSRPGIVAQTAISSSAASIPGDGTNKFAGAAMTILQAAFLILGLNWWYHRAKSEGLILPDFWVSLLQINVAIFASTLFHELGHVLGGWATAMS